MSNFNYYYAECHYAECRYAECRYAECRYAECRYAERRYAECHGAKISTLAYLAHSEVKNKKSVVILGLYLKHFFIHNLRMDPMSYRFCNW